MTHSRNYRKFDSESVHQDIIMEGDAVANHIGLFMPCEGTFSSLWKLYIDIRGF